MTWFELLLNGVVAWRIPQDPDYLRHLEVALRTNEVDTLVYAISSAVPYRGLPC